MDDYLQGKIKQWREWRDRQAGFTFSEVLANEIIVMLMEALAKAETPQSGWIDIKERLPNHDSPVLCLRRGNSQGQTDLIHEILCWDKKTKGWYEGAIPGNIAAGMEKPANNWYTTTHWKALDYPTPTNAGGE